MTTLEQNFLKKLSVEEADLEVAFKSICFVDRKMSFCESGDTDVGCPIKKKVGTMSDPYPLGKTPKDHD